MSGVEIRVRADTRQARNELSKLEKSVGKIQSVTSGLARSITTAIAGYSGFVSIKGIVQAKDDLTNLENSIALVTGRGKESAAALKRLYSIAASGRVSVETTTATFNRFGLALSSTGKSTEEIFAVTEAVAKAATLSGASAESARAAIIQLGQGLASGELRGEELNSVLEQTPRIAKAIADGMGVPFGSLRELAKDGKITSEATFNAIISQIQAIDKEFLTLKPTVGSLTTVMKDEFVRALAAIDDIGGFSDSARSKIEFLTTAFRFVADRAEINFIKVKLLLLNLRQDFTQTARLMYASVAELFSAEFTVEGFRNSVARAVESLKEFLGISKDGAVDNENSFQKLFKAPELDLSGYLPDLNKIIKDLSAFATSVMEIFASILKDVITSSSWSSLFWKGEESIGGSKFETSIGNVLKKLSNWATKIKTLFKDLAFGARGFNEFGEAGRGERSGGAVESVKNISDSIKEFVETIKVAIQQSEAFLNVTSGFTTRRQALSDFMSNFTTSFSESGGILGYLNRASDELRKLTGNLSGSAKNAIDTFILGPRGENSFGEAGRGERSGGAVSKISGGFGSGLEFLSENKIALIGTSIAGAIIFALPAELRSSLVQGALFGAGYVIAAGALFLLTQPLTLAIGGLYFLPNILDFVNSSGLATKLGEKLGNSIVMFFKGDGEGASTGQRIISAIVESAGNFGEGLITGFTEAFTGTALDFHPLVDKLAGMFSLAIIGFAAIGVVKNGLLGVTKGIASGIFGVAFGRLSKTNLKTQIGGILGVVDDEKITSRAKGKGSILGKAFSTGLRAAMAGQAVEIASEIAFANTGDKEISKTEAMFADAAARGAEGALIGATIGSAFPLIGTAIGGVVGGALGLAFSVIENPELATAISNFAGEIYDSISGFLDKIPEKFGELTTAVSEKVKGWFAPVTSFFSNLFNAKTGANSTDPINSYSNLDPKDFLSIATTKASGGYISGPGGPRDDVIPAMLSNGEFVIQAAAVQKFGRNFLALINNGIMPQGFSEGSPDPYFITLQNDKSVFESEIKDQRRTLGAAMKSGDKTHVDSANSAIESAQRGLKLVNAQLAIYDENGQKKKTDMEALMAKIGAGGSSGGSDTKSNAETLAESFQTSFRDGFYNALKTGNFKDMAKGLADTFSNSIIESFATGFTDALFKGLGLSGEGGLLDQVFSGVEKLGSGIGKTLGDGVSSSVKEGYKETDLGEGSLFTQLGGLLKGAFNSVGDLVSKSVGSLGKMFGSGGSFDIFGTIGSFFGIGGVGAHTGGLIQHRMAGGIVNPGIGQAGKDSVPVMLTPGEYVIPSQRTAELFKDKNNNGSGQQTFNINVSGDVSRQARQEIVKMIPQITSGVNAKNKENNFKR